MELLEKERKTKYRCAGRRQLLVGVTTSLQYILTDKLTSLEGVMMWWILEHVSDQSGNLEYIRFYK